jgi:hypothetical protein
LFNLNINRKMALRQTTLALGNLDLECHYYIDREPHWSRDAVIIENIIYKGLDVTDLICDVDVEFKVKLEEIIYENL